MSGSANADTIAAISTPPGSGGIGVVRVSGALAGHVLEGLCGDMPEPRRATYRNFRDAHGQLIDAGIVLWFPAPSSFTGENVAEFQGHGSPGALRAVLERCLSLGARLAHPGEFTERAYLNQRIDLAQAEAVADLIGAETIAAARAASRSLTGEFSGLVEAFCEELRTLRVLMEAAIDFPEEDIDVIAEYDVIRRIEETAVRLGEVVRAGRRGQLLREGLRVVLLGVPNVGKSSLLNRLAEADLAIVTDVAGTTRDLVQAQLSIEGVPISIVDTAGIRAGGDAIERLGMGRAVAAAGEADVGLVVVDAREDWRAAVSALREVVAVPERHIVVRNKIDIVGEAPAVHQEDGCTVIGVSALRGEGIDRVRSELLLAGGWDRQGGEGVFMARTRHLEALESARGYLERAARIEGSQADVMTEELGYAERALEAIVGRRVPDDLLGDIFSRFCIGK
ncbi:MAG: tRNA uridine-5-carboxymethylaminomethyl(34) synthesis GTPase MnmE [Betaproteobacteria bacterium]|nr:tRNA uridine-5-carboxymethylaminomethyl(34) synthesis GTPase MnmE [Betaproteobacteria bacterium]